MRWPLHHHKWKEVVWDCRSDEPGGPRFWHEINWRCTVCGHWALPDGIPPEGHTDLQTIFNPDPDDYSRDSISGADQ